MSSLFLEKVTKSSSRITYCCSKCVHTCKSDPYLSGFTTQKLQQEPTTIIIVQQ